jgi:hypothetical protein
MALDLETIVLFDKHRPEVKGRYTFRGRSKGVPSPKVLSWMDDWQSITVTLSRGRVAAVTHRELIPDGDPALWDLARHCAAEVADYLSPPAKRR